MNLTTINHATLLAGFTEQIKDLQSVLTLLHRACFQPEYETIKAGIVMRAKLAYASSIAGTRAAEGDDYQLAQLTELYTKLKNTYADQAWLEKELPPFRELTAQVEKDLVQPKTQTPPAQS